MIDKTVVGYVHCPCCPIKVRLLNEEGIGGSPEKDHLEGHKFHGSDEKCRSFTLTFKSHRQHKKHFRETVQLSSMGKCSHLRYRPALHGGKCPCGTLMPSFAD